MSIKDTLPPLKPTLLLDFANTKTLDPRITFTRASTATYYGPDGIMRTAPAGVPRFDHDPVTGESLGLLIEEQRTNLLAYSEQFDHSSWVKSAFGSGVVPVVTPNSAVAPDGSTNADTVVFSSPSTGNSGSTLANFTTVTAGTYAGSFYVQATSAADVGKILGFRHVGGDAYKLLTLTAAWQQVTSAEVGSAAGFDIHLRPAFGTSSGTVSVRLWGAQLEAGAFATSYIPTTAAAVTRQADSASMTGANFSSWYRSDEGTLLASCEFLSIASTTCAAVSLNSGSSANSIAIVGYEGTPRLLVIANSVTQAQITSGATSVGAPNALAGAYALDSFAYSRNGFSAVTDASGVLPAVNTLSIGALNGASNLLNGTIKRLAYYPKRITNAQLQALTA